MLSRLLIVKNLFSSIKVPIDAIKKLREETSAPMGECKKALQQSNCDHKLAVQWLKIKGLMTAGKRADKETREGVVASFYSPCRTKAVLVEVNCETDFVAKNQMFLNFVENVGKSVLESENNVTIEDSSQQAQKQHLQEFLQKLPPGNLFPETENIKNMKQQLKIAISRLQENIRIRRIVTLHSDSSRYGFYVHQAYRKGVGLQACVVQISVDPELEAESEHIEAINQFADDMATQILGAPPQYLSYDEIAQEEIEKQTQKLRVELAATLEKAPQHMHEKILSGKLHTAYYSHKLLGSMPYILSNEGIQVSEYWNEVEKATQRNIVIKKSYVWQCK